MHKFAQSPPQVVTHTPPDHVRRSIHVCTANPSRDRSIGDLALGAVVELNHIERSTHSSDSLTAVSQSYHRAFNLGFLSHFRLADRTWRHSRQSCRPVSEDFNSTPQLVKSLSCVHVDDTEEHEGSEQMSISQRWD